MPLLLPNLDDRSWADLADEGRALIPVYGPEWTDHNASDPGITLVELLAWITEMDIYRLNQISTAEQLRFLDLVGIEPRPPIPASAVLSVGLSSVIGPVPLPQGLSFSGLNPNGTQALFQTTRPITLAPGSLVAMQSWNSAGFQNLTPSWRRRLPLYPFGTQPQVGAALYLGLSSALPVNSPVSLYFTFGDGYSDQENRRRIVEEAKARDSRCHCLQPRNPCAKQKTAQAMLPQSANSPEALVHYGVRTVWEYYGVSGGVACWLPLQPSKKEVLDETRSFTLDGVVTFVVPSTMSPSGIGGFVAPLYYLRCRFEGGCYDAPPILTDVAFNGVRVIQTAPLSSSFAIDSKCAITYAGSGPPTPNVRTSLRMHLDGLNRIVQLDFGGGAQGDPEFLVLDYKAPAPPLDGCLMLEAAFLGYGDGFPAQQVGLPEAPVEPSTVRIYTQENNTWQAWTLCEDFLSSTRRDFHAVLEATTGILAFGNGEHGRVPPQLKPRVASSPGDCLIFAVSESTLAQKGNLPPNQINGLTDSPHNRAFLYSPAAVPDGWTQLNSQLGAISNPLAAQGGTAAETVALAAGRADNLVTTSGRVVTLSDYEKRAMETPGTRIARATAWANLHPDFPCFEAPGVITVIVLPFLPQGRPVPTAGLLQAVRSYLRPRRVIGTRVEVVGPTYLQVAINATVQSKMGASKTALQAAVVAALNTFLDPLVGGPEGTGWPFGRDVYRAEIMRIVSEVTGVDYVASLDLVPGDGPVQCGNVCVGPTWLVTPGPHQIQVL
jgi:Baseplate J-like protein